MSTFRFVGDRGNNALLLFLGAYREDGPFSITQAAGQSVPFAAHGSRLPKESVDALKVAFTPERQHSTKSQVRTALITTEV